jgi:hypothetical protein
MKKVIQLDNNKAAKSLGILEKFLDEAKVPGVSAKMRYWLGWNRDQLEPVRKRIERSRKELFEQYGSSVSVSKEKVHDFLQFIFDDYNKLLETSPEQAEFVDQHSSINYESGILGETFSEMKEKITKFGLKKKLDDWLVKNPEDTQKQVVVGKNVSKFNEEISTVMNVEHDYNIMTFNLDDVVETLADDPAFSLLISSLTFMWESPVTPEVEIVPIAKGKKK